MKEWIFEETHMASDYGFDGLLNKFYEYGLGGLVRENIQNSLDAVLDKETPVTIIIKTGKLENDMIPGFKDLKEHVNSLVGRNKPVRDTIKYIQDSLLIKENGFVSFEDENTKGLEGSRDGELNEKSAYFAYAYGKGIHCEDDDESHEEIRGGSHGVGKIASNSASKIHTMFFANCDEKGYQTLGGTISLNEHIMNNVNYRKIGYFSMFYESKYSPFVNENYSSVFKKTTRGLKIIIPIIRDGYCDEKKLIKEVIDNFLFGFIAEKLIVHINEHILDSETVINYIESDEYYIQSVDQVVETFTPLYFRTLSNHFIKDDLFIRDKYSPKPFRFKLYLWYDQRIQSGRTAIFRNIGMKIEDKKISGFVQSSYNAVLLPYSGVEDKFLKELESEAHDKLDSSHIKDELKKQNAVRFINNLSKEIGGIIQYFVSNSENDTGIIDVSDILYTLENKFATDLKKSQPTLHIGFGKNTKKIIKVKNTDDPGVEPRIHKEVPGVHYEKVSKVKKQFGNEGKKTYYKVPKGRIKRLVYDEKEVIDIDLKGCSLPSGIDSGNLMISIVDGMGKEHTNEFKIGNEYYKVEDRNGFKELEIIDNYIKNVSIKEYSIHLKMKLSKKANANLKLRYYLEV
jgi:hypothetical protein